jgi:hypothetical protein
MSVGGAVGGAGHLDPVRPGAAPVEGRVRRREQHGRILDVARRLHRRDADAHRERLGPGPGTGRHPGPEPLRDHRRLGRRLVRQERHELVATEAGGEVSLPELLAEHIAHGPEGRVPTSCP